MQRPIHGIAGATAAVILLASVASAAHNEPKKGNLFKASVVTAYQGCASGTVTTDPPGPSQSACPAVRRDSVCGFTSKGTGKLQAKVVVDSATKVATDIAVQAVLVGLDTGCENSTLTLSTAGQVTTDDCIGGPCTYPVNFTVGSCVVTEGHCVIDSTFNTYPPATLRIEGGFLSGLELGTWTFKRGTFTTFLAGIVNP